MLEEIILELCKKGDSRAQRELFNVYSDRVFSTAKRYLADNMEAEEITTDSFIKCFRHLPAFQASGDNSFWRWLKKITVNECLMRLRRKKIIFIHEAIQEREDLHPQTVNDAFDYLSIQEITAAINKLPVGYRTVFNLYAIEGMPHKEIATLLQIKEETSRTQLLKARKYLQNILEQYYSDHYGKNRTAMEKEI